MQSYLADRLVFTPDDVDLARSPLAGQLGVETFVLGAFNPALTRLPSGNVLMMVRVAEALRDPIQDGLIRSIRWSNGRFVLDVWLLDAVDTKDPRAFVIRQHRWRTLGLTSISWLLPVELSPDGLSVVAVHYEHAIVPAADHQCCGIEDPRISLINGRYFMTTCTVSPERQSTTLFTSSDGLTWKDEGLVLDHQNKDMLIFQGLIDGQFWALTRPLGDCYFTYAPDSPWLPGPSINLAHSPDALFWKPVTEPGIRPRVGSPASARMGGGAPPILTDAGWLVLWHGVEPIGLVGIYRTYWAILDAKNPRQVLHRSDPDPILSPASELTESIAHQLYLRDVVFTTGIVAGDGVYIVSSGEADLACRITHIAKSSFEI